MLLMKHEEQVVLMDMTVQLRGHDPGGGWVGPHLSRQTDSRVPQVSLLRPGSSQRHEHTGHPYNPRLRRETWGTPLVPSARPSTGDSTSTPPASPVA